MWICKIKHQAEGSIDKFNVRLVVKIFTPIKDIDYEETSSPMVKFASIRMLLVLIAHLDLELLQIGVRTTFLNDIL